MGAIEITALGIVTAAYALFEQIWATATPIGAPEPVDANGMNAQERQLLMILSEGHIDEVAARRFVCRCAPFAG